MITNPRLVMCILTAVSIIGCSSKKEKILFVSYDASDGARALKSFVCHSRAEMDETLDRVALPHNVAESLRKQEFKEVLACGIMDH